MASCKKKEESSSATKLAFKVHFVWDDEPLVLNSQSYITPGLDSIVFKRLCYLLSDFKVRKKNGTWINISDSYAYVDAGKGYTDFSFADVPQGSYDSVSFMIGLDSVVNYGDPKKWPETHPLNPVYSNMHWSWTQGYVFYAMEGYYYHPDQALFSLHIAFLQNRVRYKMAGNIELSGTRTINLQFDAKEAFQNPRVYVIDEDGNFSHSENDNGLANKIRDNLATAFRLLNVE